MRNMDKAKSIAELIEHYLEQMPNMTKDEADYIQTIIELPEQSKYAFLTAKRIFEDKND